MFVAMLDTWKSDKHIRLFPEWRLSRPGSCALHMKLGRHQWKDKALRMPLRAEELTMRHAAEIRRWIAKVVPVLLDSARLTRRSMTRRQGARVL